MTEQAGLPNKLTERKDVMEAVYEALLDNVSGHDFERAVNYFFETARQTDWTSSDLVVYTEKDHYCILWRALRILRELQSFDQDGVYYRGNAETF